MEILEYENLTRYAFFPDVFARVLLSGRNMTFFLIEIPAGKKVPPHRHPHEQMGICLAGQAEFVCGSVRKKVSKGVVYKVESNEEHEVIMLGSESGLFLDVFSPPRLEYLSMQKSFENQELDKSQP